MSRTAGTSACYWRGWCAVGARGIRRGGYDHYGHTFDSIQLSIIQTANLSKSYTPS